MKISVLQENLLPAIQDLQKSIPTRPALPILSCILIKTEENGRLSLSTTDLSIGVRSYTQCEIETPGTMAVPAKVFIEYVSALSPGKISLELKESSLHIKSATSKAVIQCFAAADYPIFPESEGESFTIPSQVFVSAVQNTSFATSVDESRPILTSLLFAVGEHLEVIGTDGFRLSTMTFPDFAPHASLPQLLLPARALNEVVRIITRKHIENVSFTISEKLKQVFFSFDGVDILVRLMEGEFPPYQKIIPAEFSVKVTFNGEEFEQKLKTALIFARESSGIIRLQIGKETLKIISSSSSLGTQESEMPLKNLTDTEGDIAFNAKYLSDFLHTFHPEEIWLGMNESLKPALFRPVDLEGYRYIVMPFRMNQ